ncbi:hypothetical protein PV325_000183, partial [Microctonus aethiopoides]
KIMHCDKDLFQDGHTQDVPNLQTLHLIRSDEICSNRSIQPSRDISDLYGLYLQSQNLVDGALQYVGLPLEIIIFTEAQLNIIDRTKPIILHFDATGANARKPQFLKCNKIFYFSISYRGPQSIIPFSQMLTSQHDLPLLTAAHDRRQADVRHLFSDSDEFEEQESEIAEES